MTEAERNLYLGLNVSSSYLDSLERVSTEEIDEHGDDEDDLMENSIRVDWSHKLPRAKGQGRCGSCWAFGQVAALEYHVNREREVSYNDAYTFKSYFSIFTLTYLFRFNDSLSRRKTMKILNGWPNLKFSQFTMIVNTAIHCLSQLKAMTFCRRRSRHWRNSSIWIASEMTM